MTQSYFSYMQGDCSEKIGHTSQLNPNKAVAKVKRHLSYYTHMSYTATPFLNQNKKYKAISYLLPELRGFL